MGLMNEKCEITSDVAAATVNGYAGAAVYAQTTAVSATPTVANASYLTTAEALVFFRTIYYEVDQLETDVAAIRTKINA